MNYRRIGSTDWFVEAVQRDDASNCSAAGCGIAKVRKEVFGSRKLFESQFEINPREVDFHIHSVLLQLISVLPMQRRHLLVNASANKNGRCNRLNWWKWPWMSTIVITVWRQVGYANALLTCFHTTPFAVKENECRRALASTLHSLSALMGSVDRICE